MRPDDHERERIAQILAAIAAAPATILRSLWRAGSVAHIKADGSPTTEADAAAEKLILDLLAQHFPGIPAVAEESASGVRPAELFFLVDPLDGTSDYIRGEPEYAVNVALVWGDRPIAAAVAAPGLGRLWRAGVKAYAGCLDGDPAWHPIATRRYTPGAGLGLVSRRHDDPASDRALERLGITARRQVSSAVKFCLVAEGSADAYIRCGQTMEWDTAAGDHILACAGGATLGPDRRPLAYGGYARGYRNGAFAALGDPGLAASLHLPGSPQG